jgi:hypothetical protein
LPKLSIDSFDMPYFLVRVSMLRTTSAERMPSDLEVFDFRLQADEVAPIKRVVGP